MTIEFHNPKTEKSAGPYVTAIYALLSMENINSLKNTSETTTKYICNVKFVTRPIFAGSKASDLQFDSAQISRSKINTNVFPQANSLLPNALRDFSTNITDPLVCCKSKRSYLINSYNWINSTYLRFIRNSPATSVHRLTALFLVAPTTRATDLAAISFSVSTSLYDPEILPTKWKI